MAWGDGVGVGFVEEISSIGYAISMQASPGKILTSVMPICFWFQVASPR